MKLFIDDHGEHLILTVHPVKCEQTVIKLTVKQKNMLLKGLEKNTTYNVISDEELKEALWGALDKALKEGLILPNIFRKS